MISYAELAIVRANGPASDAGINDVFRRNGFDPEGVRRIAVECTASTVEHDIPPDELFVIGMAMGLRAREMDLAGLLP